MKKLTSLFAMIMAAMMSFTFVSCDDDDEIADTLWGVWEGDMYVTSEWNGKEYYSSYSVIQFDKDPYDYASGKGYWVDYYSNAPWDYYASHIEWTVNDGTIRIYSIEDDTYFQIYDYKLSSNWFTGYIDDEWGNWQEFRLQKTSSPYWDDFEWGWSGWYGYSPAKQSKSASDATGNNTFKRKIKPRSAGN